MGRVRASIFVAVFLVAGCVASTESALAAPGAVCGPGDVPETDLQGRVTRETQLGGFEGFRCGLRLVGQNTINDRGANHQLAQFGDCAYQTTTALGGALAAHPDNGMAVIDVSDPSAPELVQIVRTVGTVETLEALHAQNGIVTATSGHVMDVFDVSADCREPVLLSTFTFPIFTHGFRLSDDAKTAYALGHGPANQFRARYLAAVDLSDPTQPELILEYPDHGGHDMDLSPDGNRAYIAGEDGLIILDTSDVQARRPDPEIRLVSKITWPRGASVTSHTAKWVQRDGRTYIIASNEAFKVVCQYRPQARHIDITDETNPVVIAEYGLEVNDPDLCREHNVDADGLSYNVHYIGVDDKFDTSLVFWNWFSSGVRVFDFRDPANPREIAYYNPPAKLDVAMRGGLFGEEQLVVDLTTPYMWYQPELGHLWFGSVNNGFQVVEFTEHARRVNGLPPVGGPGTASPTPTGTAPTGQPSPGASSTSSPSPPTGTSSPEATPSSPQATPSGSSLPTTGTGAVTAAALLAFAALLLRSGRRPRARR